MFVKKNLSIFGTFWFNLETWNFRLSNKTPVSWLLRVIFFFIKKYLSMWSNNSCLNIKTIKKIMWRSVLNKPPRYNHRYHTHFFLQPDRALYIVVKTGDTENPNAKITSIIRLLLSLSVIAPRRSNHLNK